MKKKYKFLICFMGLFICVLIFMLNNKTKLMANRKQFLKNIYEQSFYDTANYLHDINILFSKLKISRVSKQNINLFAQIWHSASIAHDNLSHLPYEHNLISKTLKYLSQTSDFAYTMMNKSIENQELDNNDWEKISELEKYSQQLSNEFEKIFTKSSVAEKINWDKLIDNINNIDNKNLSEQATINFMGDLNNINKEFQNYGELIYDGPFSDHVQKIEPKKLVNQPEIDKKQGLNICKKILTDQNIKNIEYQGETTTKKSMHTYNYTAQDNSNNKIYIQITKKGGYPLLMLTQNKIDKTNETNKIDIKTAIKIAKKFLDNNNFKYMQENYYELFENFVTINFAPCKNNIIFYPDLIKIKIDLTKQNISGFDTAAYLTSNYEREKNIPALAQDLIPDLFPIDFQINTIKRCVIPTDFKKEISCYEVNGNLDNNLFLVYINENTGKFEKIYRLIKNSRGTLAE